jgi:hypothetical protein
LNVLDATATTARYVSNGLDLFGAQISGGRNLQVGTSELDYTAYGYWLIQSPVANGASSDLGGGTWLTGFVTPPGSVPVTGGASYSGHIAGLFDEGSGSMALVRGGIQVQADFAARSVSGTITGIQFGSDTFMYGPMNDIAFSATLDPAQNLFRGTTRVVTFPAGPTAFTADASGVVAGRFFGPSANEVGGVWTLSDASRRLIGSFGAARTP